MDNCYKHKVEYQSSQKSSALGGTRTWQTSTENRIQPIIYFLKVIMYHRIKLVQISNLNLFVLYLIIAQKKHDFWFE